MSQRAIYCLKTSRVEIMDDEAAAELLAADLARVPTANELAVALGAIPAMAQTFGPDNGRGAMQILDPDDAREYARGNLAGKLITISAGT